MMEMSTGGNKKEGEKEEEEAKEELPGMHFR